MAKRRLEGGWSLDINPYYLDLISFRSISNAIADVLGVRHESPQVDIIAQWKSCYIHESHLDISASDLNQNLDRHLNG